MLRQGGFFLGIMTGFVLAGAVFFGAVFGLAGTSTSVSRAAAPIVAAKRALAAEPTQPKCLFVGGSSVDLGVSARRVEELTAVPSRNFGLWVPLGIAFMLDQARSVLRPGDTVVLPMEFELYDWPGSRTLWADPQFLQLVFAEEVPFLRQQALWTQFQLALRLPLTWPLEAAIRSGGRQLRGTTGATLPKNSNAWGDRTDNARKPRTSIPATVIEPSPQLLAGFGATPKGFAALDHFLAWARTNSVTVVATFPNLARNPVNDLPAARTARDQVLTFYRQAGVPFVGSFEEAQFPPEDCYDTMYHLFDDAVVRRTERLVGHLRPYLPPTARGNTAP
jgi:hypothetical protein